MDDQIDVLYGANLDMPDVRHETANALREENVRLVKSNIQLRSQNVRLRATIEEALDYTQESDFSVRILRRILLRGLKVLMEGEGDGQRSQTGIEAGG